MKILNASDYGIKAEKDITVELVNMIEAAKRISGEKTICFNNGVYFIDSEKCKKHMLYITNTVGDKEFVESEIPHLNSTALYFNNIDDLTFDGNNAVFVIDGKVTNIAAENCSNITLKNIEIRHAHPDMHEFKVDKVTPFFVDFQLDNDSQYYIKNSKLYLFGKDYHEAADKNALNAHWIGLIRKDTPDKINRVAHPLIGALKITDLKNGKIRAYYINTFRFKTGDCYYLFDVRRQFAGIFINQCKNVVLKNIKQRFNYSLALVLQDSENVNADAMEFAPEKHSARKMASVADFIQVCMCRGRVSITNSRFDGSGDDCLNVHGVHFGIKSKDKNKITVAFMHPQSHGYQPIHVGDEIAFIDPKTLLQYGKATVKGARLLNEYEIELTLDSAKCAVVGNVIEDISACPDIYFSGNTLDRIITRGLLLTTRGKIVIENNHFISNSMSGILLSDDAKSWYESGMCRDVLIKDNIFDYCGETPILIKPENTVHQGAVHKNICIKNNVFKHYNGYCIMAKSTDNIQIEGNRFNSGKIIKSKNCTNIKSE